MLAVLLSLVVVGQPAEAPVPLAPMPPPVVAPTAPAPTTKTASTKKSITKKAPVPAEPVVHEPCASAAPKGMACIPGGPAIVGSDRGPVAEKPERTVEISTFYMDIHEITHGEYQACVDAGSCAALDIPEINKKIMVPFMGADQPAVPLDWE